VTEVSVARVDLRAPARAEPRRRDIQGLRALAVAMVVAYHARLPVPGGFTGVDVFFVISGFVITSMLQREFTRRSSIALAAFYGRRFLRLTPALALLVSCVAVASALLQSPFGPQQATAQTGIGAMLLSANLVIAHASGDYFTADAALNPLLNTWTLSVEEQFYLVFPTILLVCWWIGFKLRRPGITAWVVLAITVASFWLCLEWTDGGTRWAELTTWLGGPQTAAFYFAPARAWEFGIGAFLAVAVARSRGIPRTITRWAGPLGVAMIVLAAVGINDTMPFPGLVALLPVVGTVLAILAGCQQRTITSRVLGIGPLVVIGDLSYSWYLWHWPVIVFAAMLISSEPSVLAICAVGSLIPATISYLAVEQPLRRWRPRRTRSGIVMAAVTLSMPIALCAGLLYGSQTGWGVFDRQAIQSALAGALTVADDPTATGEEGFVQEPLAADGSAAASGPGTQPLEGPVDSPGLADGSENQFGEPGAVSGRALHVAVARGCVNTDIDPGRCTWGPRNPIGTVAVLGDSQAYAVADGVIEAAADLGYQTFVSSRTGCPFLDRPATGRNDRPCAPWQQDALDYVAESRPDLVVIANRSGGYVRPERGWRMIQTSSGAEPANAAQARQAYAEALQSTVAKLRALGIGVIIVAAVPEMIGYVDQRSLLGDALPAPAFTVSRRKSEDYRRPALEVEQRLAAADPAVVSFDPNPALCDLDTCATKEGNEIIYQDQTHLSIAGAMRLVSGLRSAISAAASATATPAGERPAQ